MAACSNTRKLNWFKHPFKCAAQLCVASTVLISMATAAMAEPEKVVVHLGGHNIRGIHATGSDGDAVWAPLSALKFIGIDANRSAKGDTAQISVAGQDGAPTEVAITTIHGASMVAINDCTGLIHAKLVHVSPAEYTLLARIDHVRRVGNRIEIASSFDVVFRTAADAAGSVDCDGAYLDARHLPKLPAGVYASQVDGTTVRVALDKGIGSVETIRPQTGVLLAAAVKPYEKPAEKPAPALALVPPSAHEVQLPRKLGDAPASGTHGDAVTLTPGTGFNVTEKSNALRSAALPEQSEPRKSGNVRRTEPPAPQVKTPVVGATSGPPVETPAGEKVYTDAPSPFNLAGMSAGDMAGSNIAVRPGTPAIKSVDVRNIVFKTDNTTRAQIEVETSGRAVPFVKYVPGANRMELTIPAGVLKLPAGDEGNREITHPIVTHMGVDRSYTTGVTVQIDTTRIVGYTVNVADDKVTLDLRVPRNASGALADKLIVVDAGHGGVAGGAVGRGGGSGDILEKNVTLAIALKLRAALEQCGARVVMTRDTDVDVPLYARPRLANTIGADLFISIHNDSSPRTNSASGTTTYYHSSDPSSRALAECVQTSVHSVSGLPGRGAQTDTSLYASGLAVLRVSTMPAVLCEVAYINNSVDRRHLADPDFQKRVAQAMCEGLRQYVEGRARPIEPITTPPGDGNLTVGAEQGNSAPAHGPTREQH